MQWNMGGMAGGGNALWWEGPYGGLEFWAWLDENTSILKTHSYTRTRALQVLTRHCPQHHRCTRGRDHQVEANLLDQPVVGVWREAEAT